MGSDALMGRLKNWINNRRKPIPEPRYAVVVSRAGQAEPELLMGGIAADGAGLDVPAGVVFSSLDDAQRHLRFNGLPTRENPRDDGTFCAIRDTRTGELVEAAGK